jgi:alkylation response protein AidB-like acyl-CoA dehydrogenase
MGQFEKARLALEQVANRGSRPEPLAHLGLASLAIQRGDFDTAAPALAAARAAWGGSAPPALWYHYAGLLATVRGDTDGAVEVLSEGVSRYPSSAVLLNNLAVAQESLGDFDRARQTIDRAVQTHGALGLTEPDAGTDLAAIRTRAVRDGDHYVVNGTKTWISNGIEGNCCAVLVRTDPKAQPPRKGLSMFIMEKGPGFRASRKLEKIGYKGIDSAELVFENFRVPAANLIGGDGQGFYCAVSGLELGRINVAARGAGIAKAALDESVRYAQLRRTFGKPIGEHQAIQLKLGEMATRFEAARLLIEQAAQAYDAGRRCDMEAGMAKYFASEAGLENALEAMRIHGAYGYSKEFPIERLVRDAPLMCIGEGTNEMQRIIIARQLIERNPA